MDDVFAKLELIQQRTGCRLSAAREALEAAGGDVEAAVARILQSHQTTDGQSASGEPAAPPPTVHHQATDNSTSSEGRILGVVAHAGGFVGLPVLAPLVILLLADKQPFGRDHAKQALGWHLAVLAATIVAAITVVGLVLVPILLLIGAVFSIVAVIKAAQGEIFRYPVVGEWVADL